MGLVVVAHPFQQRIADRVRDAADELTLDDHRIDGSAAVVDHDVAQDAHAAGPDVDLDLHSVTAKAIGQRGRDEVLRAFQPRLEIAGHGIAGHARHRFGDRLERDAGAWHAGHVDAAVLELQVLRAGLQEMRCDRQRLFTHGDRRHVDRRACGDGLAAGKATLSMRDHRRVAGHDRDVVGRHVELLGADLRQCGLDALSHRHRAGVDRDSSGSADAHDAGFERTAAGALHAVANPDAEIAALGAGPRLPLCEAAVADRVERNLLAFGKVAAVERDRRARARLQRRGVGNFLGRHEIAAPHLGAIEIKFAGDPVEHALHRKCALRVAGAAHRHGRHLVGFDDLHRQVVGRQDVGAG